MQIYLLLHCQMTEECLPVILYCFRWYKMLQIHNTSWSYIYNTASTRRSLQTHYTVWDVHENIMH